MIIDIIGWETSGTSAEFLFEEQILQRSLVGSIVQIVQDLSR